VLTLDDVKNFSMNISMSQSNIRKHILVSWPNLVPIPFLTKCYVKWFYHSLCEDFGLELEVSKPSRLAMTLNHGPKPM
jgi:hypothetical protein